MILGTSETKKLESFTDIFKGTCELNGFNIIKINGECDNEIGELRKLDSKGKFYYIEDEEGKVTFRATTFDTGVYSLGEMVNMAIKVLFNADLTETTVMFEKDVNVFEEIYDDLDALGIVCGFESLKGINKLQSRFEIRIDDQPVGGGCIYKDEYTEIYIYYDAVKEHYRYREEEYEIDAYITPKNKEVLSDAFIIASNLKDAGLRVEIDYSMGEAQLGNSAFWIELDEKSISSYEVSLTDRKTHETKKVNIDNLVEELMFM